MSEALYHAILSSDTHKTPTHLRSKEATKTIKNPGDSDHDPGSRAGDGSSCSSGTKG